MTALTRKNKNIHFLLLILTFLFFNSSAQADCTTRLLSTTGKAATKGEVESTLRCLQTEIDALRLQILSLNNVNTNKSSLKTNKTWVVQVAASTDKVYATEIRKTFENLGYKSMIRISLNTNSKSEKNWYKVYIGNYAWRSEALTARDKIKKTYTRYRDCFVTSVIL